MPLNLSLNRVFVIFLNNIFKLFSFNFQIPIHMKYLYLKGIEMLTFTRFLQNKRKEEKRVQEIQYFLCVSRL